MTSLSDSPPSPLRSGLRSGRGRGRPAVVQPWERPTPAPVTVAETEPESTEDSGCWCCTEAGWERTDEERHEAWLAHVAWEQRMWEGIQDKLREQEAQWAQDPLRDAVWEEDPDGAAEDAARLADWLAEQAEEQACERLRSLGRGRRTGETWTEAEARWAEEITEPVEPVSVPAPRQPSAELLAAFGVLDTVVEAGDTEDQGDLDTEPWLRDEGTSAVLEAPAPAAVPEVKRVHDGRTAQEQLHDDDKAAAKANGGVFPWQTARKSKPREAPFKADRSAVPESTRHLLDTGFEVGGQVLYGAVMSVAMSCINAGWSDAMLIDFLRRPHLPCSVILTHRQPPKGQRHLPYGRELDAAKAWQNAVKLVRRACEQVEAGSPQSRPGAEPPVLREIRQVVHEHNWSGRSARIDHRVLRWLLTRASVARRSTLHASVRETHLSIDCSRSTAQRALRRLTERGFLSRSDEQTTRQHGGDDAYSYTLRVPKVLPTSTYAQRDTVGHKGGDNTTNSTLMHSGTLLSMPLPGSVGCPAVHNAQPSWVLHADSWREWLMGFDLWSRKGLDHSAGLVCWEISERGPAKTQAEMAARLGLHQTTVSRALRDLRWARLVQPKSMGLVRPITKEVLDETLEWVDSHVVDDHLKADGARERAAEKADAERAAFHQHKHDMAQGVRQQRLQAVADTFPELGWHLERIGVQRVPTMFDAEGRVIPDSVVTSACPDWKTMGSAKQGGGRRARADLRH